jgi:hypothetical protein
VVDEPFARRPVVEVAGLERRTVEGVDRRVVGRRERDVNVLGRLVLNERKDPSRPAKPAPNLPKPRDSKPVQGASDS